MMSSLNSSYISLTESTYNCLFCLLKFSAVNSQKTGSISFNTGLNLCFDFYDSSPSEFRYSDIARFCLLTTEFLLVRILAASANASIALFDLVKLSGPDESTLLGEFLFRKSAGRSGSLRRVVTRDAIDRLSILLGEFFLTLRFNRFAATLMTFFLAGDQDLSSGRPELS